MSLFKNWFSGNDNKNNMDSPEVEPDAMEHTVDGSVDTGLEDLTEVISEKDAQGEEVKEAQPADKGKGGGLFTKMLSGLDKTRKNLLGSVESVLGAFTVIDEDLFEELEEALIIADIGVETSTDIIDAVRSRVKRERITEVSAVKSLVAEEIAGILKAEDEFNLKTPMVMLVIGVNGVGKTTTIGKLAARYKAEGKNVALVAADTFRAAAIDQLEIWANRNDVPIIKHQENSDPAAVIYDGIMAAKARHLDVLICDTAGRLHNKKHLMEELRKINKVIEREYGHANKEVFLVLDATTGQNALQQARLFKETADITGIILTKLDGTAKGGIIIAIKNELNIPVRYIGIGEKLDDLEAFDAEIFSKALFAQDE